MSKPTEERVKEFLDELYAKYKVSPSVVYHHKDGNDYLWCTNTDDDHLEDDEPYQLYWSTSSGKLNTDPDGSPGKNVKRAIRDSEALPVSPKKETTPQQSSKPPFMDKKVLDGIKYEVYRHTLLDLDSRAAVHQAATDSFRKVLSRRLREWPICCGDHVKLGFTLDGHIDLGANVRFTPNLQCQHCGAMVFGNNE